MGLPLLVAVTTGLVWLLAVGTAQVRAVDAARETARAVARGDDLSAAVGRGGQVAPDGAAVRVTTGAGEVRVVVTAAVPGPGGLFDFLPSVPLRAEAVAAAEESP
jgi:hypothetical protein